jgi:SAM-dependent methyltransferase
LIAFGEYAPWYDLLYEDKDYAAETSFVAERLRRSGAKSGTLLDLGCGTGAHAFEFARRGWTVTGIDLSKEMIRRATARLSKDAQPVHFRQGDACQAGPERDFDAVVSLFHVASYQTSQAKLNGLFVTAHAALKPGGIFLFDYWYGGAVLAQGVETRVKVIERAPLRVTRVAQPHHDEATATVQVNYTLFCEDTASSTIKRVDETHRLHYWFPFEIEASLRTAGFDPIGHYAWLSDEPAHSKNWAAYSVARKIAVP